VQFYNDVFTTMLLFGFISLLGLSVVIGGVYKFGILRENLIFRSVFHLGLAKKNLILLFFYWACANNYK
jgi:hypothetical protein